MLTVLLPVIGILAFKQLTILSGVIIVLLFILMLSYRQTIDSYPNGGGAYSVAKENISTKVGIVAGAALSVDYIMTVAVSVSSGVHQIVSAFEPLAKYTVPICVLLVILIAVGNLRGLREASRIFGIPTYAFIVGIVAMLVFGFIKLAGGYVPTEPILPTVQNITGPAMAILMLKAFSNGCAALTGVEAVSNGVPNFKDPAQKHAKKVLLLLALIILLLFGGTAILANFYRVNPAERAMLILIAEEIFGRGFMFYYITITTFIILVIAANTAYSGFPMLISVISKDGYAPRQLSMRGNRLSFDSGIILLSAAAIILIIVFNAKVEKLIGLYAIGVFISFTLSQTGMFLRWIRLRGKHWHLKAAINGVGAASTTIVVVIIAITKFSQGAWIVVILIPILVFIMLKIKKHYTGIHDQLRIEPEEYNAALNDKNCTYVNRVIVPVESINRASIRALRYAKTISDNVTAFNVVIDKETGEKNRQKYDQLHTDIPLVIKYSPYREIVGPLVEFIESAEYDLTDCDIVSVILPQFVVRRFWHRILHNNTRVHIEKQLLKHKQIVICTMPLQLNDDEK